MPKIKLTLISREEMKTINNAQPPEAKYGDVFKAIAQAQLDDIQNRQLPLILAQVKSDMEKNFGFQYEFPEAWLLFWKGII